MSDCCNSSLAWFDDMIDHCLDYAGEAKRQGKHIVGITCEFTPRELIMAAGGVAVCLCGGSARTIPAAEEHLPANLCPLIKSTYGYHVTGTNPFIEMADLIVAETTCDGKKKMFELMAETKPVYVMELPQRQDDADALEYWTQELRKLKAHLEKQFEVEITDEKLRETVGVMNSERGLRRGLAETMRADSPPLTGLQLLSLKSSISGIPADLEQYARALEEFGESVPGTSSRDTDTDKPVRVLLTGVPVVYGAERVVEIIEGNGGLIVCMENCTGLKPILEDVDVGEDDPIRALAAKYYNLHCAVMTRNDRRMNHLRQLAREYSADCIIDLIWMACTTYDVESFRVRRLAEDELHLPFLRIETDYSPNDSARIATRVGALFEMVKAAG